MATQVSYFPMILLVVAFIVPFTMVLLWRATRTQKPGEDGAVCGQCGYSARGAASFTCPECGSDLREVGIITNRRKPWKPAGPFLGAMFWTFFVGLVAIGVTPFLIERALPRTEITSRSVTAGLHSGRDLQVNEVVSVTRWPLHSAQSPSIEFYSILTFGPQQASPELHITLRNRTYEYESVAGRVRTSGTLDQSALLKWMEIARLDPQSLETQNIADAILLMTQYPELFPSPLMAKGIMRVSSNGTTVTQHRAAWAPAAIIALWFFIWLIGLIRIWRGARQREVIALPIATR